MLYFQCLYAGIFYWGVRDSHGQCCGFTQKMGHDVAGSDAGVYPPMSDVLKDAGIDLWGFEAEK